ncbi:MAG: glycoside hydrolase family 3 C-terminal domain-containing protein [Bacilli bacterium]|jgi:beta-glucosidase|nr:glycoside hydrolase family 3 C-terminal domain-containing protein [Bacilli bacterium]
MSVKDQAKEIVSKMSLNERASLLYGDGSWRIRGLAKYGVKPVVVHDGPLGLRKVNEDEPDTLKPAVPAMCYPAPCLLACSWDPALEAKVGQAIACDCIANGTDVILAPGVNIKRNPLCGRNFEYLSEDPLLAGKMAAGFIAGCQGQGIGVSLKHFALNNQETRRFTYSAECDMRAMREIYLKPFEIAVKEAQPWTVMCSYNKIHGVYSSDNRWLLTDVLRNEWGFEGLVISDWGATNNSIYSHASGLDVEMPCFDKYAKAIVGAVKKGKLPASTIDEEAERVVALSLKCQHKVDPDLAWNEEKAFEVAREAADKSIVLLKNEDGVLPISAKDDCCIIGAMAETPRYQGAGSSQMSPSRLVSFLSSVNEGRSEGEKVAYAPGYRLHEKDGSPQVLALEALDLAHSHKKVILFLGLPPEYEAEGFDRTNMLLPDEQIDLFNAIEKVNPNIVVVISTGVPVELPFAKKCKAIVLAYLAGSACGPALYDILTGAANPSGKLAETWPVHYYDVPSKDTFPLSGDNSLYKESIFVGYRYYLSANREVLFPFGFGLSYTSFAYSELKVAPSLVSPRGSLSVSFKVTNVGPRAGEEVAQVYVRALASRTLKPLRELRAFKKVSLKPGKSQTVELSLSFHDFAHYEQTLDRYEVEGGDYQIEVGASCENILLSSPVSVKSAFKGINRKAQLPSYYNLRNRNVFFISDSEFENLLGYPIEYPSLRKRKNFTTSNSFRDISETWIGRLIVKIVKANIAQKATSKQQEKQLIDMALDSPIHCVTMAGLRPKAAVTIVDLANRKPIKALYDIMFWHLK